MSSDTDYVNVHCGRRFLDEVEYQHGVSAPLVLEQRIELDALAGAGALVDFGEALPPGSLLISAWVEGDAPSSSDEPNTSGVALHLGPPGDPDGWMVGATMTTAEGPSQGQAGELWTLPPFLPGEVTPKAQLVATGGSPDLDDLTGEVVVRLLYRRTSSEAPN